MFRTIVLLDDAPSTERALPMAVHMVQEVGGRLILLRLLPPRRDTEQSSRLCTASPGGEQQGAEARADLEDLLQRYRQPGMEVALQFGTGTDAPALVEAIRPLQADVLLLCRAKRTGLARWKREQDLPFIIRQASVPVLLLPEQAALPVPGTLLRVLVPLDGSRLAERSLAPAASLVAALAAPMPGGLHLVRVISDRAQRRQAAAYLRVIAHRLRRSILTQSVPLISWAVVNHLDVAEALGWVAKQLNQQGYRTFDSLPFQSSHVSQLRRQHGIPDRYARLQAQGMLTAEELASRLGVSAQVIWRRYHQGRIVGVRYNDRGSCLFAPPQEYQPPLAESNYE